MLLSFTATISYGMILFTPLIRWANTSELLPEVIFHGAGVNLFTTVPLCHTIETDPQSSDSQTRCNSTKGMQGVLRNLHLDVFNLYINI